MTTHELVDLIIGVLLAGFGYFAREALSSLRKDQATIWDHINNRLLPRTEFDLHRGHVEETVQNVDRKLDTLTAKLDNHFEWEIKRESEWDGKNRRG